LRNLADSVGILSRGCDAPPVITKQPTETTVEYGGTATLTIEATGATGYRK
jgi:hypothetical protein